MTTIIFVLALAVLIYGANVVIVQSEKIALHFKISEFVIGATLIALGTSLPEMATNISASFHDKADMAVGNIIGSNIMNITLVLGLVLLVARKINPQANGYKSDIFWLTLPVVLFLIAAYDGVITQVEGGVLLLFMLLYIVFLRFYNQKERIEGEVDKQLLKKPFFLPTTVALLLFGFVAITLGAHYAIESGATLALSFGVSEWFVGLLLISLGTSLPELVVSIAAAKKGKADMAIGNIIGSNLANITVAIAAAAIVSPLIVDTGTNFFDFVMLCVATAALAVIIAKRLYKKISGAVLLVLFMLFLQNAVLSL